jgi:DNA-binding beta-propeller fold protein YncE
MVTKPAFSYSHTVGFMSLQGGRGFANPVDMAFNSAGILYVLSRGGSDTEEVIPSKRVTLCTVDEEYLSQFGIGGTGDGQFMWPVSIAIDSEDKVYVADEALHRISVFNKEGHFLDKWGSKGGAEGEFNRPAGIAIDADGNLLVADSLNHRIQRYSKDGRFISQWGRHGSGPGELNMPWGLSLDPSDNVYVADWRNDRIQKFSPEGDLLSAWGTPGGGDGQLKRPSWATVDRDDNVYIADWGNERVQILTQEGGFLAKFRGDAGLSKWAYEYFTTNEDELEERQKADMEPPLDLPPQDFLRQQSAHIEKLMWGPTSIKIDSQDRIYVVDTARARIQIYRRDS